MREKISKRGLQNAPLGGELTVRVSLGRKRGDIKSLLGYVRVSCSKSTCRRITGTDYMGIDWDAANQRLYFYTGVAATDHKIREHGTGRMDWTFTPLDKIGLWVSREGVHDLLTDDGKDFYVQF